MAEARKDQNYVSTLLGVSNVDGTTPVVLWADPTTHRLLVSASGGGTATAVTVADEAADTTCFPLFVTAATGDLGPKTNAGLTFNSSTGLLTATGIAGTTGAFSNAGNAATFTNTDPGASSQVVVLQGDSASPATNDIAYVSYQLSNAAGTQVEYARMSWRATDVTAGSEDCDFFLDLVVAGTRTGKLWITDGNFMPFAGDGIALGRADRSFSDLFLAQGAVINWNGGDVTLTETANLLTFAAATSGYTFNDGVITANAGITVGGGTLALGANSMTMTGSIAATGARVTKGWFTDVESTNMPTVGGTAILTSLTAPQFTTIELGAASDTTLSRVSAGVIAVEGVTVPTISSTSTLTNKRITQRVVTTTDDATAVIDVDVTDQYQLTAMANATTISTTGTPTAGQKLIIRLKDNGTARALTWDAVFRAIGVTLPTTTVISKTHYIGCIYNATDTKWDAVAVVQEA